MCSGVSIWKTFRKRGAQSVYYDFAEYLYRTWNASQPEERHLIRLDVYYMMEHSERLLSPPEKIHLWSIIFLIKSSSPPTAGGSSFFYGSFAKSRGVLQLPGTMV